MEVNIDELTSTFSDGAAYIVGVLVTIVAVVQINTNDPQSVLRVNIDCCA